MFFLRPVFSFVGGHLQGSDERASRVARLDDGVHEPLFRGRIGFGEKAPVFLYLLLANFLGIIGFR